MTSKVSELPAGTHEEATFDYSSLPLILKLSNWMSWRAVVNNLRPGSWVDLMCGMRAMLQQSQLKNPKITQFEALDQEIDEGLERIGIKTNKQTIVDSLPLETTSHDNITFINGLEHFFADQDMLHECYRILKPGGVLQVIVPTWFGKGFLEFMAFRMKMQEQIYHGMNDHKMYYDERNIWPKLVRAGFMPSDIRIRRIKFRCSLHIVAKKAS
jgi:ubiquinone/menaquinone biosynthesis C-methylase UbiE